MDVTSSDASSVDVTIARNNNTSIFVIDIVLSSVVTHDFSCIDVRDTIRIIAVTCIDADDASIVVSRNGTTTIFIIDVTCIVDSLFP